MEVVEKKKVLVPKLRFKEFDNLWAEDKFENCSNKISSGKTKPLESGEFNVFGSTGIIGKTNEPTHKGGFILVARVGANAGQINMSYGEFGVTDNTLILSLKDSIDTKFAHDFLLKYNLNRLIFGSGQPLITGGLLKGIKFAFPTLPEQQKIAAFLSAVDEKIQQLRQKKALLEKYKKGLMQKLFPKKAGEAPELRFTQPNGSNYPDWQEKKLGEVAVFLDGKRKPIKSDDRAKMQGEYPYYGASGIIDYVNDFIFDEELVLLGEDGENIISRNLPLAFRVSGKCWVNNHAHVLKSKENYDIDFLAVALERINYVKYNTGTAQPKLNKEVCSGIVLSFPSKEEQQKIADFLSGIDQKINQVETQINQIQTFKKGLLQQMFV